MNIEMAGCAAIWPGQGWMNVVVLSVGGLDPVEQNAQRSAVSRMTRVGSRGILYDARQVEEIEDCVEEALQCSDRWHEYGKVALVVRSRWTALWKNFSLRSRGGQGNVRVFRDSDAAKKWITRARSESSPRGEFI